MYVGPWQEFYLAGGKSRKKSLVEAHSNVTIDDMRRALLNSLDAETTRRALSALEAANIGTNESVPKINKRNPVVRLSATKLPPLVLDANGASWPLYNSSGSVPTKAQYNNSISSQSNYDSQTFNSARSSAINSMASTSPQRTTISEPSKPTQSSKDSFQRSSFISSHTDQSTSISKGYDTTAMLGILRVDKHANKFKKFFGACAKQTSDFQHELKDKISSNSPYVERKLADVKRMQDVYIKKEEVDVVAPVTESFRANFEAVDSLQAKKLVVNPTSTAPNVSDMDITDNELTLISKYFRDQNDNRASPRSRTRQSFNSYDVYVDTETEEVSTNVDDLNDDDKLLQWCTNLDGSEG